MTRPVEAEEFVEAAARSTNAPATGLDPAVPRWLMPVARALRHVNRLMLFIGMVAAVAAALVLTSSVLTRYVLHWATDWQDETAVFCLVGAVFLCGAYVQSMRGHVGIEALTAMLSKPANRYRQIVVDLVSLAFCLFFGWKSWTMFHEAWVDGEVTSSTWGPPVWIPYSFMAFGMALLCLQLFVQVVADANRIAHPSREE